MNLILIAALAENRVIGNKGEIPWNISEDMKRFKKLTTYHPVIMGRKTYDSIYSRLGKPLPDRKNIVLTSNDCVKRCEDVVICGSLEDALVNAEKHTFVDNNVYVIGGQSIYEQTINIADVLELTEVRGNYEGDSFFPEINRSNWEMFVVKEMKDYDFVRYIKLS
tara:strand:- start:1576 stop:2070 length:495 start_codon:yes stop_codon:yes gene_type:complete